LSQQELVIPKVLSGKDIVLAAETGSGKTLAYIAPLSSLLLQRAASGSKPPSADLFKQLDSSIRETPGYKPKPR
jgi:superfamily II DNA/RNA helicase